MTLLGIYSPNTEAAKAAATGVSQLVEKNQRSALPLGQLHGDVRPVNLTQASDIYSVLHSADVGILARQPQPRLLVFILKTEPTPLDLEFLPDWAHVAILRAGKGEIDWSALGAIGRAVVRSGVVR